MPAAAASPWTLDGLCGTARCGAIGVSLDLGRPAAGLKVSSVQRPGHADHLLGLDLAASCPPSDHWLRGGDITAVYEPADPRRLRATAMWRQHVGDAATAVWELIASAQTSLLDSNPAVSVVADVAATVVRWLSAEQASSDWSTLAPQASLPTRVAAILAVQAADAAVLLAPHPDDAALLDATWDRGRLRLAWRLFTRPLEKGVLLRSRVLAAYGPAADTAWAARLLADFHASPPPLST